MHQTKTNKQTESNPQSPTKTKQTKAKTKTLSPKVLIEQNIEVNQGQNIAEV